MGETSFSANTGNVIGFDFSGASLPAGAGMLAHIDFEQNSNNTTLSISDVVISGDGGVSIASSGPEDASIPACDVVDCNGECDGTATIDDCGVCGGDGSSCATETVDVLYDLDSDLYGFQFAVTGATLVSASGGAAADAGFQISTSSSSGVVLAFSFDGASIPAGSGTLLTLEVLEGGVPCVSELVLSGAVGSDILANVDGCLSIVEEEAVVLGCMDSSACNYNPDATEDDGSCAVNDCAGECGGSAVNDDCGVCGGDGASCAEFDCSISDLSAAGGLNEVFLQWGACDGATSYNVYRDGELIGSSPVNGYQDSTQGDGFGLGYDTQYCYTVEGVNEYGTVGSASNDACATTLPPLQAFLQVNTSLANADVAAAASPFGDLTGDGVADGVIMIEMVNLLPVNGYQFNYSLDPGAVDVVAAIDGMYLMTGGAAGLTAQMGDVGTSGTVIGFDLLGQNSLPAAFPGNPAGVEGNLVAVLVLSPALNDADTDVNVTISDFVISGTYNGQNIGLASCDADQDPFNGCFDSDSFTTPSGAASLSFANVTSSGADLMYVSNVDIYGFNLM